MIHELDRTVVSFYNEQIRPIGSRDAHARVMN